MKNIDLAIQNIAAKKSNSRSILKEVLLLDSLDLCTQDLEPKQPNLKYVVKEGNSCESTFIY
jgi:hypothetical protein